MQPDSAELRATRAKIISKGNIITMQLRYYQKDCIAALYEWLYTSPKNPLCVLATACHAKDAEVLMHNGAIKKVQDVCVGDLLMGDDSTPRRVLKLYKGAEQLYKIIPKKGLPFVVNENHVLSLKSTNKGNKSYPSYHTDGKITNISVKNYLNKNKTFKHMHKLYKVSVEFSDKDLPLAPYVVGALLGDGSLIRQPSITTMDEEIARAFIEEAQRFGCEIRKEIKPNNKASSYFAPHPTSNRSISNPFTNAMKKIGIYPSNSSSKRIPFLYKTSSKKQRLELIAGLIDTDGSESGNGYDFISKSKQLAIDLEFLCRSVGLSAYVKECRKSCNNFTGTYYRLSIGGNCHVIPSRLKRKRCKITKKQKCVLRVGFDIEPVGIGSYYGFALDGNHLYLTSDFTVHHNSGKSVIIAQFIKTMLQQYPETRIVCCIDTKELIDQNYKKLLELWQYAPAGICSAGLGRKQFKSQILFAGIQSIYKHANKVGSCDILIIDETHMSNLNKDSMWHKFITELNPTRIIGFTATPYRNDCGLIYTGANAIYGGIAYEYTIKQGIRDKFLAEIIPKTMTTHFDVSGVKTSKGDFAEGELQEVVNIDEKNQSVCDEIEKYGKDRKGWLIFGAGSDHTKELHRILESRGHKGAYILGDTPDDERDQYIIDFKNQRLQYLINNVILTKGFDAPHIDLIAAVRPTKSIVLWVQQIGRGLRLHPDKQNCVLLDFAENVQRFGLLDEIVFSDKKKSDKEGVPPVKTCPECDSIVAAGIAECPFCGHVFPKPEPEFNSKAYGGVMLSTQIKPEWKVVERIHISKYKSKKPIPTLKIEYVCENFERYFEYICLEHEGYARSKAVRWWIENAPAPAPKNVDEAIERGFEIVQPTRIKVIQDGKFWKVLARDRAPLPQVNQPEPIDNDEIDFEA